ncbi:hypothetical protein [Imperialibacter roseus]|uniref:Uncharacterized protein n=1 Tax=Imperialibacter roseus TaxID=1324217 RepID=A0ABZ0IVI1_9BACT|nr:hypothetical protein [Imperialibacter roseus]WOK09062.1 hypothetical protein RT717_10490 [Imperialibacter roseus]
MSEITVPKSPISDAARFFHQRKGLIRFEEKPVRYSVNHQTEKKKGEKRYTVTVS